MQNWEEANRLRRFAKALEESADELELSDDERRGVQRVVDWTGEYTELLDPFSDLPDSVAEFAHPERRIQMPIRGGSSAALRS